MNILLLGGIGGVSFDASVDIVRTGGFEDILLADVNLERARNLAPEIGLPESKVVELDANDFDSLVELMNGFDVVLNGLPKLLAPLVLKAAIQVGCHVVDLGSPTPDLERFNNEARQAKIVYVAGCGATPGITNMMALKGVDQLDSIDQIDINFAAFRAFGLSPALIHTTLWEFDPEVLDRAYYDNGEYISVPPFSGGKSVEFPEPIGKQQVYFVPHGETRTLPRTLGPSRVFTRGCFPPRVMHFLRSILDYGFYRTDPINIGDTKIGPRQLLTEFLLGVPEGSQEDIWGYGLQVLVAGKKDGDLVQYTYHTTHPGMEEWGIPGAYAKNVALPFAVAAHLLLQGEQKDYGVGAPEELLPLERFFTELTKRGIILHEGSPKIFN